MSDDTAIEAAYSAEDKRIAELEAAFAGDDELILLAIVNGWDVERTRRELQARGQTGGAE